ncbi:MAG: hypothetical protein MJ176_04935 [Treponema sp.]|nr:hypothetical protein [Treponema sp.]
MKKILKVLTVFSVLVTLFSGCDNFLNSSEDFRDLMQTEIDYAKAPLVNVLVGHNNDDFGTVGTGVVNYSITAKVGYAFEASFSLKSTAGNFVGWNAYTKYDPDVPSNCIPLDESCIEFLDDSRGKTTTKVKVLKKIDGQIRLVPEVSAFPVMELLLPSELIGITPVPASFNPPQSIKALTPGQEYSITATTTVDYGFSENSEECWKVYRKDSLGNEIEIPNGDKISITKNPGSQLANGRSQSSIFITVDPDFSGRFYVSPKLITYPSMKVEVDNAYSSLVKMSHSGTVSMAKGAPYSITLQTDPSVGFKGWKLCKKDNNTFAEIAELIPADNKTTTNLGAFTPYQDTYINVSAPSYEVTETGKSAGRVNASIVVTLKEDMSDLNFSYYLIPQFFDYPVVNIKTPDNYASAGQFSLNGPGYIDNDSVRMMMDDYEYTITYKTTADYSFAETYWLVYEETDPSKNLLEENDARIEITKSSIVTDESGVSTCSVSVILKHNFGNTLNIKPIVAQKPGMNIAFADGTPNGISLSLGGTTITSGNVNKKEIKMTTGKTYTATVNVPKGYSFEGWRLVRENSSNNTLNWITESTKSTSELVDSADLAFDAAASSERPENYIRLFNAKYDFQNDGRNAGTTRATVDILFKKELSQFSLNLIPVIKAVPEISFAAVNSDYGTLTPATSDVRNLYTESKIDLSFKSTNQATVGTQIWKIKKWDPTTNAYSIDYSANVGYTNLDLTAALNNAALSAKDIIIYNNDKEPEVQPNSRGEYITTKTAVLYVNKMPDANLQLSVEPEVYNTIKFVPGTNFESTAFDSEVYIPAGVKFNFELKTKAGYKFSSFGTPANGTNTTIKDISTTTSYNGVSTVTGKIISDKNNGDAVVVTPEATSIKTLKFSKPVLSTSYTTEVEDAGTITPVDPDFIYQVEGNSVSFRFETSGEYTYEGFVAENTKFIDVSTTANNTASYVLSTGTLSQAKTKATAAKIIIHDFTEIDLTDIQGQSKKRITATLTVIDPTTDVTVKPLVKGKPSFAVRLDNFEKGSISPSSAKKILINEDYNISYISSSSYGFKKWTVTENGTTNVPVLTLDEAKGTAGTSATSFVVDLGNIQELTGTNSIEGIRTALGSSKQSKLFAIIYNTSIVESQTTEGVETATAKFRIVKDTVSTVVVSPATYKHSYLYLKLPNPTDGRANPSGRILMKAGKDYDYEFIFNNGVCSLYQIECYKSFTDNRHYESLGLGAQPQLFDTVINDWSIYSNNAYVIYADKSAIDENTGICTRKGKIRLMREFDEGKEIVLVPRIFPRLKVSLVADNPDDVSRIQLDKFFSTTGAIYDYYANDYVYECLLQNKIFTWFDPETYIDPKYKKIFSISVTTASGKGIHADPEKMWTIYDKDGRDLVYWGLGSIVMTKESSFENYIGHSEVVLYNCNVEYVGNNQYKAYADVYTGIDEVSYDLTIKPQIHDIPEVNFQVSNGICVIDEVPVNSKKKLQVGVEHKIELEANAGQNISRASIEIWNESGKTNYLFDTENGELNCEDEDDENISFEVESYSANKITAKLILNEAAEGYHLDCNFRKD